MDLTGASRGLFDIYTFEVLTFIIAVYSFPYIFIFTSSALEVVPSEMEDAANILGAGVMRTTTRMTLPLVLPAILGGAIITFLEAIALSGSPALIAIPARFNVVTTRFQQFFSQPIRAEVAAAYAVPLLLMPRSILIERHRPAAPDQAWRIQGTVVERAYLGDYWEYLVRPQNSDARIRVTTEPLTVHEVTDDVWLRLDPARAARVPGPGGK